MNKTFVNPIFYPEILQFIAANVQFRILLHFSFKSYLLNTVGQSVNLCFCHLFFGAPVFISWRIVVMALILPVRYSPSTKTCTEARSFIEMLDKAFRYANHPKKKLLTWPTPCSFIFFSHLCQQQHLSVCVASLWNTYLLPFCLLSV